MAKQCVKEPIFIQNEEELKKARNIYTVNQLTQFHCIDCGVLVLNKICRLREKKWAMRCRQCQSKHTNMNLYGVENPAKLPDHGDKIRRTCLEKYGVENPSQIPGVREKKQQTFAQHAKPKKERPSKPKITKLQKPKITKPPKPKVEKIQKIRKPVPVKDVEESFSTQPQAWYGTSFKSAQEYVCGNQYFDSPLTLAVWIWAHNTGKHITREPCVYAYMYNDRAYNYCPDFEIDGQLVMIVQDIPNIQITDIPTTIQEAAYICGLQHNVIYWTLQSIKPAIQYMQANYGNQYTQQFKNII